MQQRSELPEGWVITSIGEICFVSDRNHTTPNYQETGYPLISPKVFTKNGIDFSSSNLKYVGDDELIAFEKKCNPEKEDILYSRIGTIGEARLLDFNEKFVALHSIALIKPTIELKKTKIVYYFLQSELAKKQAFDGIKSIGVPDLGLNKLNTMSILLPPLPEQHRIVSAIEALFARLDATNEKLDRVQEILKKFRESVLTSAFNGRLTEDWRVVFHNSKVEIESFEKYINVNSIYFSENPMTTNNEVFPALPNKWRWDTIEQLASNESRSIQSGPFGSNLLHSEFQETGVLAIGIDNVLYRSFSLGKEHRISNEKYQELKKYTARPLDVLITVMATVGRCCVVPQDIETAIITKHVYRITPNREIISPHYLMNALSGAAIVKEQIDNQIRGQTRPGINGKILKETSIPLPPLPEQQEIVRRVNALFAFADSIEAKVAATKEKTEKLRQSILAKAFSGELVETEAEIARREGRGYETAEVLLGRIKAEKGKNETKR